MTTQKLSAAEIRERYLRFFERHGHTIVPSTSLVVADDPTLLFVNSGMVPFKDVFLGHEQRPYSRATTAQKCLRVSGKHNDLEEVGPSPRHQTFFEMLGNFSFGDYFKAEAIAMAWKLLTEEFKLPVERLWFTVFAGDDEVPADDEAAQLWIQQGADPARVLRFGRKDNFWVMGDTGPCGPCSEITIYIGDDLAKMRAEGVNSDDPDYVEIWNNVFMQYERASMKPLPRPSVDTGMGLERMAMAMQGVHSTYETDVFVPIISTVIAALGSDEAHYRANFAQYRAIADHSRAIAFLIADGVLPGNNGRSYVLRRILRRAAYQGRSIGFERPFLAQVIATVIDQMGHAYPQLVERRDFILESADAEEQQFLKTLAGGITRLNTIIDQVRAAGGAAVPGVDAFVLKDTYGFPLDLTQRIAGDVGLTVDEAGYEAAMSEQRERSRAAAQFKRGGDAELWADKGLPQTEFLGYSATAAAGKILALVANGDDVASASAGSQVQVVLDRTPFYAESGGQVGDSGHLYGPAGTIRVDDTLRPAPGLSVHYGVVESGQLSAGDTVRAEVDTVRRADIQRNHTATHMLQRALRDVVGEHAAQAGSLVAPDRLRFDFTHNRAVEPGQLREIESRLNAWVRADGAVSWDVMDYQSAIEAGAIALFGEKYGDRVRLVTIDGGGRQEAGGRRQEAGGGRQEAGGGRQEAGGGRQEAGGRRQEAGGRRQEAGGRRQENEHNERGEELASQPDESLSRASGHLPPASSKELCGGTHVARTGEIGYVRLVGESSIGSGIRRIEALTGRGAEQWVEQQAEALRDLAGRLGVPVAQVAERVEQLLGEGRQRQQDLDALRGKLARASIEGLLDTVDRSGPAPLLAAEVPAEDVNRLREMGDWLRDKLGSGVVVLGAVIADKPMILTMVTPDLVKRGYHAGNLVKSLAQIVGGGGGGRPEMAQAGGRDVGKLAEAITRAPGLVAEQAK